MFENGIFLQIFFTFFYTDFWESDSKSGPLYQQCIEKDIAWSIACCLPDEENRMSKLKRDVEKKLWKGNTVKLIAQFKITYLLTILKTSEYHVCKKFIGLLVKTIKYLE